MDRVSITETIVSIILKHYPMAQAIYLFGSYAAQRESPTSDVDIALLLPPAQARQAKNLGLTQCRYDLEAAMSREIDLLNARQVSTVIQKEFISGVRIYCAEPYAADEFEMLVISYYQKLNDERREILDAFFKTGRAYAV